jgi:hypothetical protein
MKANIVLYGGLVIVAILYHYAPHNLPHEVFALGQIAIGLVLGISWGWIVRKIVG